MGLVPSPPVTPSFSGLNLSGESEIRDEPRTTSFDPRVLAFFPPASRSRSILSRCHCGSFCVGDGLLTSPLDRRGLGVAATSDSALDRRGLGVATSAASAAAAL
jgi:hypothetical protein